MTTLQDLFLEEMRDIFDAEQQLCGTLPKMAEAASSERLRQAIEFHLEETEGQMERLAQAFALLDKPTRGEKCEAMKGLIKENREILSADAAPPVKDAGIICAAQKVEHYEIASYGCLCTYADLLGLGGGRRITQSVPGGRKECRPATYRNRRK